MVQLNERKLNWLMRTLPEGLVVDAAWLERHGYSSSLRSHYVQAGWLAQPAPRVYARSPLPLRWEDVVKSLQNLLDHPLAVGGRTALEEQGFGHYLQQSARKVHLYGEQRPPSWLEKLNLDVAFHYHNSARLFGSPVAGPLPSPNLHSDAPTDFPNGSLLASGGRLSLPLVMSSPERAILEWLDELPDRESFHQIDMVMEGLANLRPSALQSNLADCRSVKVKRLFFFFADRHRHGWLARLNPDAVDLGSGKRVLTKGGKLDQRYLITVPGEFHAAA
ncbi:type IV toxin-antitoxin system AbiEi family antitoxin domain-containing protein [Sphingomonas sp. SRS2]|uniref:type IV toxin-antitoxin system AbiEi family antitoxin domain-containing protein n=1 Tax=Sphingomonas sp. SRS2 TaxID=133190 RepID=UPI000618411B|nr:type IV toxin-antitoxin system AbiEi family antitoxin domain-containing protein [Sphingomonas sp. SRS2]KKC24159.1 hypothetical protein WP12_20805 [Sphingomonas sp. SRS2]